MYWLRPSYLFSFYHLEFRLLLYWLAWTLSMTHSRLGSQTHSFKWQISRAHRCILTARSISYENTWNLVSLSFRERLGESRSVVLFLTIFIRCLSWATRLYHNFILGFVTSPMFPERMPWESSRPTMNTSQIHSNLQSPPIVRLSGILFRQPFPYRLDRAKHVASDLKNSFRGVISRNATSTFRHFFAVSSTPFLLTCAFSSIVSPKDLWIGYQKDGLETQEVYRN